MDRDDVEAARTVREAVAHDVVDGELRDPVLLQPRDRFGRLAELVTVARLDLDEHDRLAIARDDVNFSTPPAVAPGKYCVPPAGQFAAREIFAGFSERDAGLGHDPPALQDRVHDRPAEPSSLFLRSLDLGQ